MSRYAHHNNHHVISTLLLLFALSLPVLAIMSSPAEVNTFFNQSNEFSPDTTAGQTLINNSMAKMGKFSVAYRNAAEKLERTGAGKSSYMVNHAIPYFAE